jgi:dTDP-4-dehydrorhamnose reductase
LDLSSPKDIANYFSDKAFNYIINCAAYTAVDKAEKEFEMADSINHLAVRELAKISKAKNISLIHISTDYVFNGKKNSPYNEDDSTEPLNVYGKTKLLGEKAILEIAPPNAIIIRTSWLYSSFGNNFVKSMLKFGSERESLNVVFDQVGTPTYARDLAHAILDILPQIKNITPAIYHYANEGVASWYDFTKEIFKKSNLKCEVKPITKDLYPTPAERPHFSVLNKSKIKNEFGVKIPYWKDSLEDCLIILKKI